MYNNIPNKIQNILALFNEIDKDPKSNGINKNNKYLPKSDFLVFIIRLAINPKNIVVMTVPHSTRSCK